MNNDRISQFTEEIGELKVAGAKAQNERWLFLLGAVALVVGVALAVYGGIQAAGTPDRADQTAFIASGSLLGLAAIVAGAALFVRYSLARFFRYWLVRLVHEQRTETDRLIKAIESARPGGPSATGDDTVSR